jgi:hypothetical protein
MLDDNETEPSKAPERLKAHPFGPAERANPQHRNSFTARSREGCERLPGPFDIVITCGLEVVRARGWHIFGPSQRRRRSSARSWSASSVMERSR